MPRFRRRPAPRHKAPPRLRGPRPAAPPASGAASAVRRALLTPTFAAGLGVVVAAVLASSVTQEVLRYSGPPADKGQPCLVKGCATPSQGEPALAPGTRLLTPRPRPVRVSPTASPTGTSGPTWAGRVIVVYRPLSHQDGPGNFTGAIVLVPRTGHALGNWSLQFTYPADQIISVMAGATPVRHGAHAATVTSKLYQQNGHYLEIPGGYNPKGWSWDQAVRIVVAAEGQPGPPTGCVFNGHRCHYR